MSRQLNGFLRGFGSVFTLSGQRGEIQFFHAGKNLAETTVEEGIRADWGVVGKGLFDAMGQIDVELTERTAKSH